MKNIRYFISMLIIVSTISSCTIYGLTNDEDKLATDEKTRISQFTNNSVLNKDNIYLISGSELKAELAKYPKSIVYTFKSGCSSIFCKPLYSYEEYASKNGYKLFMILVGFTDLSLSSGQNLKEPLFVIDAKAYNTKYRSKYMKLFKNELKCSSKFEQVKEYPGNLYFFKSDSLIEIYNELPE